MPVDLRLEEAVVVITGAGSGIGRGIALAFAKRGSSVVVADIDGDAAGTVAEEIRITTGTASPATVDVSDEASVAALADRAFREFGRVSILCNNAGVSMRPFRTAWDATVSDFQWTMAVNFMGVVHGLRSFVPRMLTQPGHKHIVNTSSYAIFEDAPGHAPYAASKAAISKLSDATREELAQLGHDVGVTTLLPGTVPTAITTAERLRPTRDRSANRDGFVEFARAPRQRIYTVPRPSEDVGEMVVEAVLANSPLCLTHPIPTTSWPSPPGASNAEPALPSRSPMTEENNGITFEFADGTRRTVTFAPGQSIMQVAVNHDISGIVGECGGLISCATCHVHIDPAWTPRLTPSAEDEADLLAVVDDLRDNSRLGCQVTLTAELAGLSLSVPETGGDDQGC